MIPAIKAKTTAFLVDDKREFLNDLKDMLPDTHFFTSFTNPLDALEKIKLQSQPGFTRQASLLKDFKATEFEKIVSVIIVDHRMKPINGYELCQQIGSASPKRIMLTSHASKDLAVKAFNNKLIDAFLLKTEDNILELLSSTIEKCTLDYFNDVSIGINGFKTKNNPLIDPDFTKFFNSFCAEHKIESHCCFHNFYNILLRDQSGKETYMSIYDADHLDDLLDSEQAKSVNQNVLNLILTRQAAPCFKDTESAFIPDGDIWNQFMVPLKTVAENLFIAIN